MRSVRSAGLALPLWIPARPLSLIAVAFLSACANVVPPASDIRAAGAVESAFVVVGAGGARLARLITTDNACPAIMVDEMTTPMQLRAAPATVTLRPTRSDPADSKPSAFPVRVCDMNLPRGASRAVVAGRSLPLSTHAPKRIVVLGDTGCRIHASEH